MIDVDVRKVIESTVEPLSDIARERAWQRIEDVVAGAPPVRAVPGRRGPRLAVVALGVAAAAAAVVVVAGDRETAPVAAADRSTFMVEAGARIEHRWAGGALTIYGPAEVELAGGSLAPRLVVRAGAVRARRGDGVAALVLATPTATSWVTGADVAVRVVDQATELGAGATRADALIARHLAELGAGAPPAAVAPPAPPAVNLPPLPSPPSPPPPRPPGHPRTAGSRAATSPARGEAIAAADTAPDAPPADAATADAATADAAPAPDAPPSLADVYLRAEDALRRGDRTTAVRLLAQIVQDDPDGRLAAAARYDLARLAFERGAHAEALRLVDAIVASPADPNLHRPAQVLRCRIRHAQGARCTPPD